MWLVDDIRSAVRRILRAPRLPVSVILILSLAVGANVAVFSVTHAVLLRNLPFPKPEELVRLATVDRNGVLNVASFPEYLEWARRTDLFARAGAVSWSMVDLQTPAGPTRVCRAVATSSLFQTLAAAPLLGRLLTEADDKAGTSIVLTESAWRRLYAADAAVIGRVVILENGLGRAGPHEIVGVLSKDLRLHQIPDCDLFGVPTDRGSVISWRVPTYTVVARLRTGVTREQAELAFRPFAVELLKSHGGNYGVDAKVLSLHEAEVGSARRGLVLLSIAVGALLIVACANLAGLLLSASMSRAYDYSLRMALGATSKRLVRMLIVETLLLGVAAGLLGLAVALACKGMLVSLAPPELPRLADTRLDTTVLAFAVVMSLLAALGFGLGPAWAVSRMNPARILQASAPGGQRGRWREGVLATQLLLVAALLVPAGLAIRSLARMSAIDPGFAAQNVVAIEVPLGRAYTSDAARLGAFRDELLRRANGGHTDGAALTSELPLTAFGMTSVRLPDNSVASPVRRFVTPGYFRLLRADVVQGRALSDRDRNTTNIVINETMARRFQGLVLGQTLRQSPDRTFEVVGVVRDIREWELTRGAVPAFYQYLSDASAGVWLLARADDGEAQALLRMRAAIREVDPSIATARVTTLRERMDEILRQPRFLATALGVFAALALTVAAVGIVAVIQFEVRQRTREMAIREAVGGSPWSVRLMLLRRLSIVSAMAVVLGLLLGTLSARAMQGLLFEVSPVDAPTLGGVGLVLVGTVLLAGYMATRSSRRQNLPMMLRQP